MKKREAEAGRFVIPRPSLNFSVGWKFYLALLAAGTTYYIRRYQPPGEWQVLAALLVSVCGLLLALLSLFLDRGLFRILSLPVLVFLISRTYAFPREGYRPHPQEGAA